MKARGNGVGIVGMGACLPEEIRTNDWWPKAYIEEHFHSLEDDIITAAGTTTDRPSYWLASLGELAKDPFRGARERRVASSDLQASDLEKEAIEAALADSQLSKCDLDAVITYSIVPDCPMAGTHAVVARKLGLAATVTTMTVGAACASFIPQVQVASAMVLTKQARYVAVVSSNIGSRAIDYRRPSSIVVGDGAVACIVGPVSKNAGVVGIESRSMGEYFSAVHLAPMEGDGLSAPWYQGSKHRSDLVVRSTDRRAAKDSTARMIELCQEICSATLSKAGWGVKDLDMFVASQPVAWFGVACADALEIDRSIHYSSFEKVGHLMPASLPYNLMCGANHLELGPGSRVLLYSPGAGMVQTAMTYEFPHA